MDLVGKSKYKRLVDLYVAGTEYVLKDGTPMWLQVLNPFEREVVRREAQVAQARQILAMKEHGSSEHDRVKANFYAEGRNAAIDQLVDAELTKNFGKILNAVRDDPDWTERLEILDRGTEDAGVMTTEEELLLGKIEAEFYAEVGTRAQKEREFLMDKYESLDHEALWQAFLDTWLERLGGQAAMAEFKVAQIAYATRACEAVRDAEGTWTHEACNGHDERVWDTLTEVRSLPDELMQSLTEAFDALEMTEREAKNSDRQTSSSASSRLPSEEGASTPSIPNATPDARPGISSSPSPTPSPSTDGSNSPTPTSPHSVSG